MATLITLAILTILFSFLCSIWEAVLLTIPRTYAQSGQVEGRVGELLNQLKDEIDRPLSAILTLNTIAHTVGAMFVGATAHQLFGEDILFAIGPIEVSKEAITSVIMVILILIASEIIPKTIGALFWKRLVPFTVYSVNVTMILLYPAVWISEKITGVFKSNAEESVLDRDEFSAMAELGIKEGIFEKRESAILTNLLALGDVTVKDIMTPRMMIKAADEDTKIEEFYEENKNLRFSRIPLYAESIDRISGFFLKDALLQNLIDQKGGSDLKTIKRDIKIFNETMPIPEAFKVLLEKREHIALVVDEFGGTEGIVTMEDIIETLLGTEIIDEFDSIEDLQQQARNNWKIRAKKLGVDTDENKAAEENPEA